MKKISIILMAKTSKMAYEWMGRHKKLISRNDVNILAVYWYEDLNVFLYKNVKMIKGCENPFERIRAVLNQIHTEYTLICAADDLYDIGDVEGDYDVYLAKTFFVKNSCLIGESVTNKIELKNDRIELTNYWAAPLPGDNSIFYSIIKTKLIKNVFKRFPVNLRFHGLDWAYVSILLYCSRIKRSENFTIYRDRTQPMSYTNNIIQRYAIKKIEGLENIFLENQFGYMYKFIYNQLLVNDNDLYNSMTPKMFDWLKVKVKELQNNGVYIENDTLMSYEIFKHLLVNYPQEMYKIYEV